MSAIAPWQRALLFRYAAYELANIVTGAQGYIAGNTKGRDALLPEVLTRVDELAAAMLDLSHGQGGTQRSYSELCNLVHMPVLSAPPRGMREVAHV